MPYAPGNENIAGQIWSQNVLGGIRSLGGSIEDWAKKHEETQQKIQTADLLKEYADKQGFTTPEFQAKYAAANAQQKADMAAGLSQTIVLQAHEADKQAELANAIEVAQIHATASRAAARQGARGPATVEELAYAQSYAPPGYNAVPTATGWQLVGKDPGLAQTPAHKPGDIIYDPGDPKKAIGMWQKNDEIKYFAEVDPAKQFQMEQIKKFQAEQDAAKAQGTGGGGGGGTTAAILDFLRFGPAGRPTPVPAQTPMPSAAPSPTYPPVAPQGATVSPAPTPMQTPAPVVAAATPAPGGGKQLDAATAAQILQAAGGDPVQARALAKQYGYVF